MIKLIQKVSTLNMLNEMRLIGEQRTQKEKEIIGLVSQVVEAVDTWNSDHPETSGSLSCSVEIASVGTGIEWAVHNGNNWNAYEEISHKIGSILSIQN